MSGEIDARELIRTHIPSIQMHARIRYVACLVTLLMAWAFAMPALAATAARGEGHGAAIDLQLLPLAGSPVSVQTGPLPDAVSGDAPPDFSNSGSAVGIGVNLGLLGDVLSTGVLSAQTETGLVPQTASSEGVADDVVLKLEVLGLLNLLSVSAEAIGATASAACVGNVPQYTGSATLANAAVAVSGVPVTVPLNPAPNTQLLNALGIKVMLNEQVLGNDGVFTVRALHLDARNSVLSFLAGQHRAGQCQRETGGLWQLARW